MNWSSLTIVCNGADWIAKNLRHHAPFFDRQVVVEGPALEIPAGRGNGLRLTGGKPHSTDGTREILRQLEKELPNLRVLYSKGVPWKGKTAMCNAGLTQCLPGGLCQIDADEFWFGRDIAAIKFLMEEGTYTDMDFFARHFWPTVDYHTKISPVVWGNKIPWRRVFRWQHNECWNSHEPPRFKRPSEHVLSCGETRAAELFMFHYGYTLRRSFRDREIFYKLPKGSLTGPRDEWLKHPDLAGGKCPPSVAGPLVRYTGEHPIDVAWLRK